MKNCKKIIVLLSMLIFVFNTVCFAKTSEPDKFIASTRSVAWVPNDTFVQPQKYGTMYNRVMYLTKADAIAYAEGYKDSEFKKQFKTVMDYVTRTGSYAAGAIATKKIVEAATKLKCAKVVKFFSGVGGAITIGFIIDECINLVKTMDYKLLRAEIDKTKDDYFVQIKLGIASNSFVTAPVCEYKAWNSKTLLGIKGFHGGWTGPYAPLPKPPAWLDDPNAIPV